jgi:hypothetical protein
MSGSNDLTQVKTPPIPPAATPISAEPAVTAPLEPSHSAVELVRVLDGYLADLQAGKGPNRAALLAAHPDLAGQLEQCLAGIEFIHRAGRTAADVPTQLGDFRIRREIGRGGMGVVYEAEQLSLHRTVALKILRFGAVADAEAVDRFRNEAETVAKLHHTNIVPIFAIGSENGVNFYAMQFIQGESLAEVIARRSEVGDRKSEVESQRSEIGSRKAQNSLFHWESAGVRGIGLSVTATPLTLTLSQRERGPAMVQLRRGGFTFPPSSTSPVGACKPPRRWRMLMTAG